MRYIVTLEFETSGKKALTNDEEQSLQSWMIGTMDNAPYDADVGFPAKKLEHYAMIIGFTSEE